MGTAAWLASILAQAGLVAALWRSGARDWWTAYLAAGIVRALALWPISDPATFYWAWIITEVASLGLQFAAVWSLADAVEDRRWLVTGLLAGALAASWSIALTGEDWPTSRRARLLLMQLGAYHSAGVILGVGLSSKSVPHFGIVAYFILKVFRAVAEQIVSIETVNVVYLLSVTVLFSVWSLATIERDLGANA